MIVALPILAAALFLGGYELFALATGRRLVTEYIRAAFRAQPGAFMVLAFAMGVLFGHLFWFQ